MKKPGIFDEAIHAMSSVVDFSCAPDEVVTSCRDAARVLRAAQGLGEIFRHEIIGHYIVANGTGMNQLFRAILAARRRAERGKK